MERGQHGPLPEAGGRPPSKMVLYDSTHLARTTITGELGFKGRAEQLKAGFGKVVLRQRCQVELDCRA